MIFIHLIMFYVFMQVLNSAWKPPTKNYYFLKYILFSTIYLLQEQKLNPRNYSKMEIIMSNFV
jgi:heme/copper-type cytochrome/quinol oxidase subunit 3